jgi:ABC-type uncharacterized transport system auxiliary subunit
MKTGSPLPAVLFAGLLGIVMAMAGGCGTTPPVPADSFYRLAAPNVHSASALTEGLLLVESFEASGLHNERAILFSEDSEVLLRQHHYHYWMDAPPRLLQHQLIAYLREAGAAPKVVADARTNAALIISGRIVRMERSVRAGATTARVALEMQLRTPAGEEDGPLMIATYAADIVSGYGDLVSVVEAFGEAVNRVFAEFLEEASLALVSKN